MPISTGLDRLAEDPAIQQRYKGNAAYLCHNASVDKKCREGIALMKGVFGKRLKAIFSPQHGLFSEAQDNMVESRHSTHPYYQLPVHSLYSETRSPTPAMLEGIDHVFVDLQDVGCRAYTFIYTMTLMMQACAKQGIQVVVLDRPNPLGGIEVEGNVLEEKFKSFIGLHPLPMRHGLTIGEIARMAILFWGMDCPLDVITMQGWQRSMPFDETGLPWAAPSPNMPQFETALAFPATVLLEGANLSEGRGTTRPFELFGHPALQPHALLDRLQQVFKKENLGGFTLRPLYFQPTFDKHAGRVCGGFQLHLTHRPAFKPWQVGQVLLRELYQAPGPGLQWRQPPFEYENHLLPIDILNGADTLRQWVESNGDLPSLEILEQKGRDEFAEQRQAIALY